MSVSRHAGEEFYLIEIKNSDIQMSSDFCFFDIELPAAVQILLFDSNKKIMTPPWEFFATEMLNGGR